MQKQGLEERRGIKNVFSRHFSIRPPQKRKSLTVQGEFGKIIDVVWRKLCSLTVYMGNVRINVFAFSVTPRFLLMHTQRASYLPKGSPPTLSENLRVFAVFVEKKFEKMM